jgi:cell cycle sensor histidine kinase DivJ
MLKAGLAAGCDRLLNPAIVPGDDRNMQARLIAVLLASPFFAALPLAQALGPQNGIALTMAATCALFGLAWAMVLGLAATGNGRLIGTAALIVGGALAACLSFLFAGAASPAMLLAIALPIEAGWITRDRRTVLGVAAGTAAILVIATLSTAGIQASANAWHWLAPAAYLVTLALRFRNEGAEADADLGSEPERSRHGDDVAVIRLDGEGEVVEVEPGSGELLGVEPELMLGRGFFDRLHVGDRVGFLCALSTLRAGGSPDRIDVRLRRPGSAGAPEWHWFRAEFAATPDGSMTFALRDGSEVAALREEIAALRERVQAGELAKGRFLAAVSHELRTPLNAIIGFSEMLLHEEISGTLPPKHAEQIGLIREAGNHLLSVVNAILDVSRIEAGAYQINPEPFELRSAAALCTSMMMPQAHAKQVTLATRITDGVGDVVADQRAVQQILLNLLSNAIKFTPEGGTVRTTASRRDGKVWLRVSDTGIGMAQADLELVGRPFVQVQNDYTRQFQGSGLGLSLVKGLVRLHGGTFSIESAPGLGTTVTVMLPGEAGAANPIDIEAHEDAGEIHAEPLRKIA